MIPTHIHSSDAMKLFRYSLLLPLVLFSSATGAQAQSLWALKPNQTLCYELEIRQGSKPVIRQIVDLTWLVRKVDDRGFSMRVTVDRVRVDLKGGRAGFEIDTDRETETANKALAALIIRRGADDILKVVGESFWITLGHGGQVRSFSISDDLSPLCAGLPEGNLRALLETGIMFPAEISDEWTFQENVRQSDGTRKTVVRFKGRIARRDESRIVIAYEAGPRDPLSPLPSLLEYGGGKSYTRKGRATFDLSLGYLIKSRERFAIKNQGKFMVLWRYAGEGRAPPPGAPRVEVVVVSRLTGKPVAGAKVCAGKKSMMTDAQGRTNVFACVGCVVASAPRFVTMDFTFPRRLSKHKPPHILKLSPAAAVRGRVTDRAGLPVTGVLVSVNPVGLRVRMEEGDSGIKAMFLERDDWNTKTDRDGCFHIPSLPAGIALDLRVIRFQESDIRRDDLKLEPGETRELVLEPKSFGTVRGRIIDAQGNPIWRARVRLTQPKSFRTRMFTYSVDDGSYCLEEVPVGEWAIRVGRQGEGRKEPGTPVKIRRHGEEVVLKPIVLLPVVRKADRK